MLTVIPNYKIQQQHNQYQLQDEITPIKQEFMNQFYDANGNLKPEYKRLTYNDNS